jgi:hypothetical protein
MTSRLQGIQELHGRLELEKQSLLSQTRQERQFHSADCPMSNPRYPPCQVPLWPTPSRWNRAQDMLGDVWVRKDCPYWERCLRLLKI